MRSFIHSFHSCIHVLHPLIHWFIDSLIRWFYWLIVWLIHSFVHPHSFVIHSFLHSFLLSFIQSFIHSWHVVSCPSNLPRIPTSKLVPIAVSYFRNFFPHACWALPGIWWICAEKILMCVCVCFDIYIYICYVDIWFHMCMCVLACVLAHVTNQWLKRTRHTLNWLYTICAHSTHRQTWKIST